MPLAFNVFHCLTELEYITLLPAYPDCAISFTKFSCSQDISNFLERGLQVELGVFSGIPEVALVDRHCWINHLNSSS